MHGGCGRLGARTETQPLLHHRPPPCWSYTVARLPLGSKGAAFGFARSLGVTARPANWRWTVCEGYRNNVLRLAQSNVRGWPWQVRRAVAGPRECRVELAQEKAGSARSSLVAVSFYKIVDLPEYKQLRQPLLDLCDASGVAGDIALAANGINGTICGTQEIVDDVLAKVQLYPSFTGIWRVQLPLIPDVQLVHQGQKLNLPLEVVNEAAFDPLQSLRRSVCHIFGGRKGKAQNRSSGECIRKEPVLDLHLSLAALSARSKLGGDSANSADRLQELSWIRTAVCVRLAWLLSSATVFVMSCYRDKLGDPFGFFVQSKDEESSSSVGAPLRQTPPFAEGPASVPWNPVALNSRLKWQRRDGKNISRPPTLKNVAAGTLSAASAQDYKPATTLGARGVDSSQATAVNNSLQVNAQGGSGESAVSRKKRKVKKRIKRPRKGKRSAQRVNETESCQNSGIPDTTVPEGLSRMGESACDAGRDEVANDGTVVFQSISDQNGLTPSQSHPVVDKTMDTSKQGPEKNDGVNSVYSRPGTEGVTLNHTRQMADFKTRRIRNENVRPAYESQSKTAGGDKVMSASSTPEGEEQGSGATLDWISQVVDQREKWIVEPNPPAQGGPEAVSTESPVDGSLEPLEEIASSVETRLRMLQSRLVATQSALQSERVALTGKDDYLSEIHSRTSAELSRASDALEFREDELLRTISALRNTHVDAKAKASMDVMEEHNELAKFEGEKEAFKPGVPLLKRTARVVWPNPARQVAIAGSFNGWTKQVPMRKSNAGVFVASLELYPGRYEIKFVVDGSWRVDARRPIVYDEGYENNVLIIS